MMVLKKKEIIAAALVVLIGMAGYLNWSYQDSIKVTDGDSYIETGKTLGEAQYVNADAEATEDENSEENAAAEETAKTDEEAPEGRATDGDEDPGAKSDGDNPSGVTVETATDDGGYFSQAKMNKESSRAKSLEILNQTAANESFDKDIRDKAGDQIIAVAENVEKESQIESIAQSKGYNEICVFVDEDEANVMVRKDGFGKEDVVKLTEIVTEQLNNSAQNIKIVEVK